MLRRRQENRLPEFPAAPRRLKNGAPTILVCLAPLLIPHVWIGLGLIGALFLSIGVAALGTDVDARVLETKTRSGKKGTVYEVRYGYVVDGESVEKREDVSASIYARASAPGATLHVRHFDVGTLHGTAITEDRTAWAQVPQWIFVACFWNGIVSVFVYQLSIAPLRRRSLIKNGQVTQGEIASKRIGQKNARFVTFRFFGPTSDEAIMSEMAVTKEVHEAAVAGTPVTVLYDPRKPSRAIAYELSGYVVAM
ncbi:MAG TPA: DUF3592 domain-containing protein [Planctomycetota bacterium]|nr:DUF3592 domain-containing protein [Planctomycetota bacterium]